MKYVTILIVAVVATIAGVMLYNNKHDKNLVSEMRDQAKEHTTEDKNREKSDTDNATKTGMGDNAVASNSSNTAN